MPIGIHTTPLRSMSAPSLIYLPEYALPPLTDAAKAASCSAVLITNGLFSVHSPLANIDGVELLLLDLTFAFRTLFAAASPSEGMANMTVNIVKSAHNTNIKHLFGLSKGPHAPYSNFTPLASLFYQNKTFAAI